MSRGTFLSPDLASPALEPPVAPYFSLNKGGVLPPFSLYVHLPHSPSTVHSAPSVLAPIKPFSLLVRTAFPFLCSHCERQVCPALTYCPTPASSPTASRNSRVSRSPSPPGALHFPPRPGQLPSSPEFQLCTSLRPFSSHREDV